MTLIILQARMDSSRLPGKSLLPLGGKPLVLRVMEALNAVRADVRILACPEDCADVFADQAARAGFAISPGPRDDVLARYCLALRRFGSGAGDRVIRATGDNPFVFADTACALEREASALGADYAGYAGLPHGAGTESVSAAALFRAEAEAARPEEREHVCPYLYCRPDIFLLHRPLAPRNRQGKGIRLTVDTREDYERAQALYGELDGLEAGGKMGIGERYNGEIIIAAFRRVFPHIMLMTNRSGTRIADPVTAEPITTGNGEVNMDVKKKLVLAVPACGPGLGGGHLVRCLSLVRGLRERGREAFVLIPSGTDVLGGFDRDWITDDAESRKWECVVLDRFRTPPEELSRFARLAPVIGIDEGGRKRSRFDFLIDILPSLEKTEANFTDPSLLPLPEKPGTAKVFFPRPLEILVSFGMEDRAGLGPAVVRELAARIHDCSGDEVRVTFLENGYTPGGGGDIAGIERVSLIPDLRERLGEYDLVFTHFGLTAFEAVYSGVPAILVSPGAYHEKLARKAGFFSAGTGKSGAKRAARLLFSGNRPRDGFLAGLRERRAALAARYGLDRAAGKSLAEMTDGFAPELSRACPACGEALNGTVLARFAERSYRRCAYCRTLVMDRLTPPPFEYDREYFFESYRKQYGKTYIEDFPHLTAEGKRRALLVKSLLSGDGAGSPPRLLDIGCAYGPFLVAAREAGFVPYGIDPAEDAVRYVTETLGIHAERNFFPPPPRGGAEADNETPLYDAVTLWYVIEHFTDCVSVLKEIRKRLKPGGVLAFSTPSHTGISGRVRFRDFLKNSPADHRTIWSPYSCVRALKKAGFRVRKTLVRGHHPERFPLPGKRRAKGFLYGFLLAVSRIFSLGDTFEVYAVRLNGTDDNRENDTGGGGKDRAASRGSY